MAPPCPKPLDDALFATLEPVCWDLAFRTVDAIWRVILANAKMVGPDPRSTTRFYPFLTIELEREVAS